MELSLDLNKRYSYADYLTWLDDKARELINGFIKMMSAPRVEHAEIIKNINWQFESIVRKNKGKCKVFFAPFDVRFPKKGETDDDKIDTVVQPDICVICDLSKLDVTEKFSLYEVSGVKEYWIVHSSSQRQGHPCFSVTGRR